MIGGCFLGHREFEKGALPDAGRAQHRSTAAAAAPRNRCGNARHHREDLLDAGVVHRLLALIQMPAGNMAGLVREDADQLVGRLRAEHQTGVHKDILTPGDERVDAVIRHQVDVNSVRVEPSHLPHRGHHRANVAFDLGVPQQGRAITRAFVRAGDMAQDQRRSDDRCGRSDKSA